MRRIPLEAPRSALETVAARGVAMLMATAATLALLSTSAGAQAPAGGGPRIGDDSWRIGASVGTYMPRSAVIVGRDGKDTRLGSATSFTLDLEYRWQDSFSLYGSGTLASSAITLGSALLPTITGPSDQVLVMAGTAGVVLSTSLGPWFRPTLRLGGGLKGYAFDLASTENQWRPTADIGVGFRGSGNGPIGVSAEVRYLPSSFDQGKLPIRGITPQAQRQTDLLFSVGVSIRP